jgi:hypothetical protein
MQHRERNGLPGVMADMGVGLMQAVRCVSRAATQGLYGQAKMMQGGCKNKRARGDVYVEKDKGRLDVKDDVVLDRTGAEQPGKWATFARAGAMRG